MAVVKTGQNNVRVRTEVTWRGFFFLNHGSSYHRKPISAICVVCFTEPKLAEIVICDGTCMEQFRWHYNLR
jgi:hypothetical protein